MFYTPKPYAIDPKWELESLRLNDAEKAIVEKFKSGELSDYYDVSKQIQEYEEINKDLISKLDDNGKYFDGVYTHHFESIDQQRVIYACIFEKSIEQNIDKLTPYTINAIENQWRNISGVTYQNLQNYEPMNEIDRWNQYGLMNTSDLLDRIVGNGYIYDSENKESLYGDIMGALKTIAGLQDGKYTLFEDKLLEIIDEYVDDMGYSPNDVLGHINYFTNDYFVREATSEINEKLSDLGLEEIDELITIYDSGDSYVDLCISDKTINKLKEAIKKDDKFFDDLSHNAKEILGRTTNSEELYEMIYDDDSCERTRSKSKQKE